MSTEDPKLPPGEFQRRSIQNDWKGGSEFAPFHRQASHIRPDYRDGWNDCYSAAQKRIAELEVELASRRTYRASVFEEAAKVCEEIDPVIYRHGGETHDDAAGTRRACIDAIRALATKTLEG